MIDSCFLNKTPFVTNIAGKLKITAKTKIMTRNKRILKKIIDVQAQNIYNYISYR